VAGAERQIFHAKAISAIHRYAGGVPRLINTLCDNCLFEAYLRKLDEVDPNIVHSVAGDFGLLEEPLLDVTKSERRGELEEIESLLDSLEQKL
jgi:hypothetical protein